MWCLMQGTSAFQVKCLCLLLIIVQQYKSTLIESRCVFYVSASSKTIYQVRFEHFETYTSSTHTLIICRNKDAHTFSPLTPTTASVLVNFLWSGWKEGGTVGQWEEEVEIELQKAEEEEECKGGKKWKVGEGEEMKHEAARTSIQSILWAFLSLSGCDERTRHPCHLTPMGQKKMTENWVMLLWLFYDYCSRLNSCCVAKAVHILFTAGQGQKFSSKKSWNLQGSITEKFIIDPQNAEI